MANFICNECGYEKQAQDEHIGKSAICPKCKAESLITKTLSLPPVNFEVNKNSIERMVITTTLVRRSFPFIAYAKSILYTLSVMYFILSFVFMFVGFAAIVSISSENPHKFEIAFEWFSESFTFCTTGALLTIFAQVGYGLACWLADQGYPEKGEQAVKSSI